MEIFQKVFDNREYWDMNDKAKYAKIVKQLEEISMTLGKMGDSIFDDDKSLTEKFFKLTADIMFDLTVPIVKKYPSLRPPIMLDDLKLRYNIMRHDDLSDTDTVVRSGIQAKRAEKVLAEIESAEKPNNPGFFYMELSGNDLPQRARKK